MFRSTVLSQTGRLLSDMHLYSKAIPYIKKSNDIDILFQDNDLGLAYNHHLIAFAYRHLGDLGQTRYHIEEAIRYSKKLPDTDQANILTDLARLYHIENKNDSALNLIRSLPLKVDSICLNYTLATTSEIYLDAGILDTAYLYARRLIESDSHENHKTGYKVLFSDKMRKYISNDTLISLITDYRNTMDEYMDSHDDIETLIQNSSYNYTIHERERKKAEQSRMVLYIILMGIVTVGAVLLAVVMFQRWKTTCLLKQYNEALTIIERLKVENHELENNKYQILPSNSEDIKKKKKKILDDIKPSEDQYLRSSISEVILQSDIYRFLQDKIRSGNGILDNETENVWKELEAIIETISPGFRYRLRILSDGKMSESDWQLSLLIRCGFSTNQIAILLNRAKNTVSSRRSYLAKRIFGSGESVKLLDSIIFSL